MNKYIKDTKSINLNNNRIQPNYNQTLLVVIHWGLDLGKVTGLAMLKSIMSLDVSELNIPVYYYGIARLLPLWVYLISMSTWFQAMNGVISMILKAYDICLQAPHHQEFCWPNTKLSYIESHSCVPHFFRVLRSKWNSKFSTVSLSCQSLKIRSHSVPFSFAPPTPPLESLNPLPLKVWITPTMSEISWINVTRLRIE